MEQNHVNNVIKKANRHLFLVHLKRAKVYVTDIISVYCACSIRPVLEYGAQPQISLCHDRISPGELRMSPKTRIIFHYYIN